MARIIFIFHTRTCQHVSVHMHALNPLYVTGQCILSRRHYWHVLHHVPLHVGMYAFLNFQGCVNDTDRKVIIAQFLFHYAICQRLFDFIFVRSSFLKFQSKKGNECYANKVALLYFMRLHKDRYYDTQRFFGQTFYQILI